MTWHQGRLIAFDTEASDKDPETARIVTAALVGVGGGQVTDPANWLLNPGIPMEPEAIKVHGITDEYAAEHGLPARNGVMLIADAVAKAVRAGLPLVGHNVAFDLTLLDRECRRHGLGSLEQVCGRPINRVVDTMVIDRHVSPFRRRVSETQGPYQMRTSAEVYGLGWDEDAAHGAEYDALQSARVAWWMGEIAHRAPIDRPAWVRALRGGGRFSDLAGLTLEELFDRQKLWHAAWAREFQAFLRRSDATAVVDGSWPMCPVPAGGGAS